MLEEVLFQRKQSDVTAITALLFYKCPLRCGFCKQDQADPTGLSVERIKDNFRQAALVAQFAQTKEIILSVIGGELFADFVSDELLDTIADELIELKKYINKMGKELMLDPISTCLIFKDWRRVKKFILTLEENGLKVRLGISYDKFHRFAGEPPDVFWKNEYELFDYTECVSFVLTKQQAEFFLSGEPDEYLDYFYTTHKKVSFSFYSSNFGQFGTQKMDEDLTPSDDQILECIKYFDKHYPEFVPVKMLRESKKSGLPVSKPRCNASFTILPDGKLKNCCFDKSPKAMTLTYAERYGCLSCGHFEYCAIPCVADRFAPHLEENNDCLFSGIYDILKGQPE